MSQQRVTPLPRTAMTSSVPPHTTPTITHTTIQPSTTSPPIITSRRGPTVSAIVSYGAAAAACHTIQVLEEIPDHSYTRQQRKKAVSNTRGGGLSPVNSAMPSMASTPVEYAAALVEQLSLNGVASRLPHRGLPSSSSSTVTNSSTLCNSKLSWFTDASPTTILPTPQSRSQLSDRTSSSTTTSILTSPNGGLASVFDNIGGASSSSPLSSPATATRASPSSSNPTTLMLYIPVIDASALQAEESLMPELLTYLRRASGNTGNSGVEEMMIIPVLLVDTFSPSFSDLYSKEALEVIAALRENCFVVDAVLPSSQTSRSSGVVVELLTPDDVALKITYLLEELRQVGEEAAHNKGGSQVKFDVPASNRHHPATNGHTPLAWSVSSQAGGARGGGGGGVVIEPPSVWRSSSNADDAYNLLSFDSLEENGLIDDDGGKSTNSQKHKTSNTSNNIGGFVSTDVSVHDVLVRDLRGFTTARSLAAATRSQLDGIQSSSGSTPSASPLLAASGVSTRTLSPPLSPDAGGSSAGSGSTTTNLPSSNVKVNTGLVRRLEEALTVAAASSIRSIGEVGGHHRVAGGHHVAAQAQGRSCLYEKPTAVSSGGNGAGIGASSNNHLSSSSLYALVPKTSTNQNPIGRGGASSSDKASDDLQHAGDGRFPYAFSSLSQARRMTLLHITHLDLSNLFLGDLGVSSLCVTFLPYLVPRLRALNLDGNGISEKGIRWLIGKKRAHSVPETSQFSEKVSGGGIAGHPSLETVLLRDNRLNQPAIVMLCGFVSVLGGTAGASLTTINVEANPFNFSTHWCGQLESLLGKRKEKLDKVVSEENIQAQQNPLINHKVPPPLHHDYSTAAAPTSAHRLTMSWTVSRELGGKWYGRVTISTRGVPPNDGGRYFSEDVTFGPMPIITYPTSTSPHHHHHGHERLADTFSECLQMIRTYFNIPNTTLVKEEGGGVELHHHHYHQTEKATTSFVDTQCLTIRRGGGGGSFRLVLIGKEGDGLEGLTQATLSSLIAACSVAKNNQHHQHHQQAAPAVVEAMKGVKHRLLYVLVKGVIKSPGAQFDVAAKLVFEPPVVVGESTNNNKMTKDEEEEDVLASSVSTPFTPRSPFFLQATFRLATTSKTVSSATRDGDGVNDGKHHGGSDISVVSIRRSVVQYMTSQVLSFVGCLHEEILLACSQL